MISSLVMSSVLPLLILIVYSAGVNVVAIVAPLSGLVLVALSLADVFLYCKR